MKNPVRGRALKVRRAALDRWRASGLTQADFCRRERLHPATFSGWKRQLALWLETSPKSSDVTSARATRAEKVSGGDPANSFEDRLAALQRMTYGRKSEQLDPSQQRLVFDGASPEPAPPPLPVAALAPQRKGHGRGKLPAHLPRERTEHAATDDRLRCPCGTQAESLDSGDATLSSTHGLSSATTSLPPARPPAPDGIAERLRLVQQSSGASEQGGPPPNRRRRDLPNREAVIRLVGAVLAEMNDGWGRGPTLHARSRRPSRKQSRRD